MGSASPFKDHQITSNLRSNGIKLASKINHLRPTESYAPRLFGYALPFKDYISSILYQLLCFTEDFWRHDSAREKYIVILLKFKLYSSVNFINWNSISICIEFEFKKFNNEYNLNFNIINYHRFLSCSIKPQINAIKAKQIKQVQPIENYADYSWEFLRLF